MQKLFFLLFVVSLIIVTACAKKSDDVSDNAPAKMETTATDTANTVADTIKPAEEQPKNVQQQTPTEQPKVKAADTPKISEAEKQRREHIKNPTKQMRASNVSFAEGKLFSGKYEVSYTISNRSEFIDIKNVTFRVDFMDDENNVLGTDNHTFNRTFVSKARVDTTMKSSKVKGTKKVKLVCVKAESVN